MTKRSRKFAQLVGEKISSVELIGDCLIYSPTHHIVRGFSLERTLDKDEFYMWNIVVPLFCASMTNMTLNYSNRFSLAEDRNQQKINICTDEKELSGLVAQRLNEKIIPAWADMFSVKNFLREFDPRGDCGRINMALDLAIAHCLSGNAKNGKEKLKKVLEFETESPIAPRVREVASSLLDAYAKGNEQFQDAVTAIENANIMTHFPSLTRILSIPSR